MQYTYKRETKAILEAGNELKCSNLILINMDKTAEVQIANSKIKFVKLEDWLNRYN